MSLHLAHAAVNERVRSGEAAIKPRVYFWAEFGRLTTETKLNDNLHKHESTDDRLSLYYDELSNRLLDTKGAAQCNLRSLYKSTFHKW
jgi:hypothetical protein